jgi:hypothetical protein
MSGLGRFEPFASDPDRPRAAVRIAKERTLSVPAQACRHYRRRRSIRHSMAKLRIKSALAYHRFRHTLGDSPGYHAVTRCFRKRWRREWEFAKRRPRVPHVITRVRQREFADTPLIRFDNPIVCEEFSFRARPSI